MKNLKTFEEFLYESIEIPDDISLLSYGERVNLINNIKNKLNSLIKGKIKDIKGRVKISDNGGDNINVKYNTTNEIYVKIYLQIDKSHNFVNIEHRRSFEKGDVRIECGKKDNWSLRRIYKHKVNTIEEFAKVILDYDPTDFDHQHDSKIYKDWDTYYKDGI